MNFSDFWNDMGPFDILWMITVVGGIALAAFLIYEEANPSYDPYPKKEPKEPTEEEKKKPVKNITVEYNPIFVFFIYWTLSFLFFSRKGFWLLVHSSVDAHLLGFITTCFLWACTMSGIYIYKKLFIKEHERILTEDKAAQEKLKKEIEKFESYQRSLDSKEGRYEREIRELKWEISKLNEQLKKKSVILKTEPKKKRYGDDGFEF